MAMKQKKPRPSKSSRISKLIGYLQQERIAFQREGDAFRARVMGWRIGRLVKKYYAQLRKEGQGK